MFWQAIGATLLISAAPFFILFFIPLDNSQEKQWLLKEYVPSQHLNRFREKKINIRTPLFKFEGHLLLFFVYKKA